MESTLTEYAPPTTVKDWCELSQTAREWVPSTASRPFAALEPLRITEIRDWRPARAGPILLTQTGRSLVGKWRNGDDRPEKDNELERTFRRLVDNWRAETRFLSSVQARSTNRWYQMIIGLGEPALPHLLRELERAPDHWFWALRSIAREDPVETYERFNDAVAAWLKWGRDRNLL